jgi:PKD repeat protein
LSGNSPVISNKSKNANQFQWFIGTKEVSNQVNPQFKSNLVGDFSITLITKQDSKCSDTLTLDNQLSIYPKPRADFDFRSDFIEQSIGEVLFINKSLFSNRYFWDFGDGLTDETLGPLHEYDINRNIKVKLIAYADYLNSFTCSDTITKEIEPEWITTFHAPNALAPESGNPEVQIFKPVGIGIKEYEIQIISPWGMRVWYSNKLLVDAPEESWNGRKDNIGSVLPQGAYIWQAKITFVSGKKQVFTGSVNLLR